MNTPEPYRHDLDRTLPEPTSTPDAEKTDNALAVHRDPSVPSTPSNEPGIAPPTVAWVRPTDMPTLLGSTLVGRGIDLQSELTRVARRAPGTAASTASRRITRTSIARTSIARPANPTITNTTSSQEGLGR